MGLNLTKSALLLKQYVACVNVFIKRLFQGNRNGAVELAKLEPCAPEEVYDLSVPGLECFCVEGGIIVHNSADAVRYLLLTLKGFKSPAMDKDRDVPEAPEWWGKVKRKIQQSQFIAPVNNL